MYFLMIENICRKDLRNHSQELQENNELTIIYCPRLFDLNVIRSVVN